MIYSISYIIIPVLSAIRGSLRCGIVFLCVRKVPVLLPPCAGCFWFFPESPRRRFRFLRKRSYQISYRFGAHFARFSKNGGAPGWRAARILWLSVFLIVLPEDALDLLLGLHDLVVKAFGRDAHGPVTEDDELL